MRFGIDFGTTRIIVAAADRGNFPLVSFESDHSNFEWFPSLAAVRGKERRYGWEAWHAQADPEWTVIRSLKRFLEDAGPQTQLDTGTGSVPLSDLFAGMLRALHAQLTAQYGSKEIFEVMLGVPANANSNQRFLTVDAFRRSGFEVLGLLNEPSAAAIEFGHRQKVQRTTRVLVYDLGGGTFDASLVELGPDVHTVLATESISTLGGDDFDRILAELAVGANRLESLDPAALFRFEEECRRQKEALHANSRRIVVDLDVIKDGMGQVTVPVADFYERCRPLLAETIAATTTLADRDNGEEQNIDALYVTGGGSELPIVGRMLRDAFGRKVKRSEYTRSATAIGLAIQADAASGYTLREMFTRNFGVWRERDAGRAMVFDPIFPAGTRLPVGGEPLARVSRQYTPVHNIGHFRYLEAGTVLDHSHPAGDLAEWDQILFPFDPTLAREKSLEGLPVEYSDAAAGQRIEESYTCDPAGSVVVTISNLTSGYEREYRLGRWSQKATVVKPSAKKRTRKAAG
jgi:molecular chaperone DnaK (HSP70)